jgi:hypothetical protein
VNLIVVDLVPALLTWEGRDASEPSVAPNALDVLDDLYAGFRLAAIGDGDRPAALLREALDGAHLAEFFESVGTSAGFGPTVTPRVIRRLAGSLGAPFGEVIVVTARPALAEGLRSARMAVILTDGPGGFTDVPDAVAGLVEGPFNP